ncbi:MAG: redox-sensing transcriptional repressor Rex [Clostridiaceae bacterium]
MNDINTKKIPRVVISRFPKYYRYLQSILCYKEYISSSELSKYVGINAGLIRHDLHYFGKFGKKSYGYDVRYLYNELGNILKLNKTYGALIIGVGNLGSALCKYYGSNNYAIEIKGLFDVNPKIIGVKMCDIEVQDIDFLDEFLENNNIDIGIICVPATVAQNICDRLSSGGVKAIWNYSYIDVISSKNIVIRNEHLSDSLALLAYKMNNNIW